MHNFHPSCFNLIVSVNIELQIIVNYMHSHIRQYMHSLFSLNIEKKNIFFSLIIVMKLFITFIKKQLQPSNIISNFQELFQTKRRRMNIISIILLLNFPKHLVCFINFVTMQHILVSLYYSLIYPYLIYGNLIWGNIYQTYINNIFMLQKKVVLNSFRKFQSPYESYFLTK